jgi:hypothetical protein
MIQISFQLFVILIFIDVLREIRADVAENLARRDLRRWQKGKTAGDENGGPSISRPLGTLKLYAGDVTLSY